jgi:hypothetical protein
MAATTKDSEGEGSNASDTNNKMGEGGGGGKKGKKGQPKTAKPHKTPPPHGTGKGKGKGKPERLRSGPTASPTLKDQEPNGGSGDDDATRGKDDDTPVSTPDSTPPPTSAEKNDNEGGSSSTNGDGLKPHEEDSEAISSDAEAQQVLILYLSIAIVVFIASCFYCIRNFNSIAAICCTSMGFNMDRATQLYSPVVMTDNEMREMELSRFNRMAQNNAAAYPAPSVPAPSVPAQEHLHKSEEGNI